MFHMIKTAQTIPQDYDDISEFNLINESMLVDYHIDDYNRITTGVSHGPSDLLSRTVALDGFVDSHDIAPETKPSKLVKPLDEQVDGRKSKMMKSLEDHALFVAGKLTEENKELQEKLEALTKETGEMKRWLAAIPIHPEKVAMVLEKQARELMMFRTERRRMENGLADEKNVVKDMSLEIGRLKERILEEERERARLHEEIKRLQKAESEAILASKESEKNALIKIKECETLLRVSEERLGQVIIDKERAKNQMIEKHDKAIQEIRGDFEKQISEMKINLNDEYKTKISLRDELEKTRKDCESARVGWDKSLSELEEIKIELEKIRKPWWKKLLDRGKK